MESLGEYLKREREFRNISLEEISRKTKIRENILKGLEEDRIDSLASPVFVKGYLKAYAGYVGLDPNEVVLRYEASLREEKEPPVKKTVEDTPRQWSLKYIVLPVSVLLLVGIFLFLALQRPMKIEMQSELKEIAEPTQDTPSQAKPDQLTSEQQEETISPTHPPRKEALLGPPPIHPSRRTLSLLPETPLGIDLKLRALEDTWIQIQIDERPAREIFLRLGEVISRRGEKSIEMKVGNAGGLEVFHNGKDLGRLGESGKVVYLSISPEKVDVRGSAGLPLNRP